MLISIIVLFGIGYLAGSDWIPTLFRSREKELITTVTCQKPYAGKQDVSYGYAIELSTGTIENGIILWKGNAPSVYGEVVQDEKGQFGWVITNHTNVECFVTLKSHYYYLRNNKKWEEMMWEENNELNDSVISIDPNSTSELIPLSHFQYDAFWKTTNTDKLSKGTYRIVTYVECITADPAEGAYSFPYSPGYTAKTTDYKGEWWCISYDITVP